MKLNFKQISFYLDKILKREIFCLKWDIKQIDINSPNMSLIYKFGHVLTNFVAMILLDSYNLDQIFD